MGLKACQFRLSTNLNDPELVLLGYHADRNKNPRIKQLWEHIAKKQNGLGLKAISMSCGALTLTMLTVNSPLSQRALCLLTLIVANQSLRSETSSFIGFDNEVPRNDQNIYFVNSSAS